MALVMRDNKSVLDDHDRDTMTAIRDLISHHPPNPEMVKEGLLESPLSGSPTTSETPTRRPTGSRPSTRFAVRLGWSRGSRWRRDRRGQCRPAWRPSGPILRTGSTPSMTFTASHYRTYSTSPISTTSFKRLALQRTPFSRVSTEGTSLWTGLATNFSSIGVRAFEAELRERGDDHTDPVWLEVQDVLYILRRSRAVIDGARDIDPRDVHLLMDYASASADRVGETTCGSHRRERREAPARMDCACQSVVR